MRSLVGSLLVMVLILAAPVPAGGERAAAANDETTTAAGAPLYTWQDQTVPARAVVLAVHGTTKHGNSFARLADYLSEQGFVIVSTDLRGHGKWHYSTLSGQPGHDINYERSVEDVGKLLRQIRKDHPGLPVFCLGESVGSVVIMRATVENPGLVDGVILSSTGTRPRFYRPDLVVWDFLQGITNLDRPLDVSHYITLYASEDKRITREMLEDPLTRNHLTGRELLHTAGFLTSGERAAAHMPEDIAVLILQGERDHIVSAASVKALVRHMKSEDKKLVVFPAYGHVLLGTAHLKPEVVNLVTDWLLSRSSKGAEHHIGMAPKADP